MADESEWKPGACGVCESPTGHPKKLFCLRCDRFRRRVETRRATADIPLHVPEARVRAMRASWSGAEARFRCHYSGVRLVEDYPHPAYPTFDHTTPRDGRNVTFVAALINDMKTVLSDEDFKELVIEMGKKFQGLPYDQQLIEDIVYRSR